MAEATAMLNSMAGVPRARSTTSSDETVASGEEKSSNASTDDHTHRVVTTDRTQSLSRKSATRLSLRSSPAARRQPTITRGTYDVPDSPKRTALAAKPNRKILKRAIGRSRAVEVTSPLKGVRFGKIGPVAGASLTSYNTPARTTRSRTVDVRQRLQAPRSSSEQILPVPGDQHSDDTITHGTTRSRDTAEVNFVSSPVQDQTRKRALESQIQSKERDAVDISRGIDHTSILRQRDAEPGDDVAEVRESIQNSEKSAVAERESPQTLRDELPDARKHSTPKFHPKNGGKSSIAAMGQPQEEEITSNSEMEDIQQARKRPRKAPKRRAVNDEERRLQKEIKARQWAANAEETARSNDATFRKLGVEFLRGIGHKIERADLGDVEEWSNIGAAAMTIENLFDRSLPEAMNSTRVHNIWRHMLKLENALITTSSVTEEEFKDSLEKLRQRAGWSFLRGDHSIASSDLIVAQIFGFLIPKSVQLLKLVVQRRLHESSLSSMKELWVLAAVSEKLCKIALTWTPKPSVLEGGIRRYVRNSIAPNLRMIMQWITHKITSVEDERVRLTRQREINAERERALVRRERQQAKMQADIDAQLEACRQWKKARHLSEQRGRLNTARRGPIVHDAVDTDDIDDANCKNDVYTSRFQAKRQVSAPQRNSTCIWTEEEDTALIEGLQKYQAGDRYIRICESAELIGKNVEQCRNRAKKCKYASRERLAQAVAASDRSLDWLASVE